MPTANPIPSSDPSDLLFNAQKLDETVNSASLTFTDRLGAPRKTMAGIQAAFDAQLADAESDLNVYRADAAASAAEALGYLQTYRATSYGALASDPATDPLGNQPTVGDEYFNTTSNLLKRFNGATWQASDINTANLAAPSGSSLVGYDDGMVQDVLDHAKPMQSYIALRAYTGRATGVRITTPGIAGFFQRLGTIGLTDNGGTVIVDAAGRAWERLYSGNVNIQWFGAVGNGLTDDTAAFVAANTYLMTKALPPTNQTVESQYVTLEIPEGIYKISGNRIFGSQIPTGQNGTTPPRMLRITGEGASIIWDVSSEDDELFYFDGTITNPRVSGLSIYVTKGTTVATGAGYIFRFYSNTALTNQAAASKLHLEDVSVFAGRRTSGGGGQRPKGVFFNTGNAMCDQVLAQNCRFWYMQKVWIGQNDQAVNVTFSSCSFFGASNGLPVGTTYFEFTRMNDNFNLVNCSISVQSGETLIKTNSPISGGLYVETGGYNFNFDNTRIEFISGASNVSWTLCDMNFGKLNFRNTNLRLSAFGSVKTIVRACQLANLNFDNVQFNATDFYFPIATSPSFSGALNPYGAHFKNCVLLNEPSTTYSWSDGTTNYDIKTTLISTTFIWRPVRFDSCGYLNGNGLMNWSFGAPASGSGIDQRAHETVTYSQSGVAFGKELRLPPYQAVKKISVNMAGSLPDTFDTFRVWVGDRTLSNTFDVDNIRPDIRKNAYTLFDGNATVFYGDTSLQTIEVALLNSGAENNSINSEIAVEYAPLDARSINITTTADQVKLYRASRSIDSGTTAQRPNIDLYVSQPYFDTTLGKPIWWNGSVWKDAAGTTV